MNTTRQCAESCLDLLILEVIRSYNNSGRPPAAAALEAVGFRVGRQLIERMTCGRQRFSDQLEAIKFVCKEFWAELFRKQIDNLKTNHRGVFVLQDNRFRWLMRLAPDAAGEAKQDVHKLAQEYLAFPCGLVQGALCTLGVNCSVTADSSSLPICSFTVRIKSS
mmetsp:Transcript_12857/g.30512  ORF Transcript_12857/g.30512 Transcript_12857/m.30512 type:complete len:164 (+) Transcript_12857:86-577(+)